MGEMNKNNFIVKFAHFYLTNIKSIKEIAVDLYDGIIDEFLPSVFWIFMRIIGIIIRVLCCILPVKQTWFSFITGYLVVNENGSNIHSGYYLKKDLEKLKEINKQSEENADA
jgi:hypothetical protein